MCAALLSWLAVVVPVVCGCSCNKLAGYECSCSSFRCRSFDVVSLVAVVGVSVVVVVGVVFVYLFLLVCLSLLLSSLNRFLLLLRLLLPQSRVQLSRALQRFLICVSGYL